ncbi:MAG: hypothetical protein WC498_04390 [Candidatus Saccharimonadales bacterium]
MSEMQPPIGMPWSEWANTELEAIDEVLEPYCKDDSDFYSGAPKDLLDLKDHLQLKSYTADIHDDLQEAYPGTEIPFPEEGESTVSYVNKLSTLERKLRGY